MLLVKRLDVRPTSLLLLVTVEWYLRNAVMGEVMHGIPVGEDIL